MRDRANVALGFSALSENRPKDARDLPRARSPAEPAVEQGAARLRLGRRRAGRSAARARAMAGAGSARLRRDRGPRGADRDPLRLRQARRLRPVAAALRGGDRRLRARKRRPRRVDQGDPRRQDDRHPGRAEPGRGDGLVLEDPRPRRDAARAPPGAGARPARVPGSAQELPRPALPGEEPRGLAREAGRLRGHAGDPAQGVRRSPAAGSRAPAADRRRGVGQAARGPRRRSRRRRSGRRRRRLRRRQAARPARAHEGDAPHRRCAERRRGGVQAARPGSPRRRRARLADLAGLGRPLVGRQGRARAHRSRGSAKPSATPMRCRRRNARSRSASIASRAASPPSIRSCR